MRGFLPVVRMTLFRLALLLVSSCALFAAPPSVRAGIASKAPKIDGRIQPDEWAGAGRIDNLPQQIPLAGQPHRFRTTVLVLADADHLYFGFICEDPAPRAIAIHTMRPDDDLSGDDTVAVALDSFGDRRTGYLFRVNAAGARQDGLIARPTEEPSLEWTGIWDARTSRFAGGWMAEVVIPARTLNFRRGLPAWGVNFERHVARERLTLNWAAPQRDAQFTDLSRAGTLEGIEIENPGKGLEFVPYLLGRRRVEAFAGGPPAVQATGGMDFGWRITPDVGLVLTTNTDFAETEVDLRQVNTTRFPLFFPERRAFFLEGSNQFEFGLGLETRLIPFFSRRVGLADGRPQPIDFGARLLARSGNWNAALLNVQTGAAAGQRGENLTAARVTYDVTPELRIGTLVTNGDPGGGSNHFGGVDLVWRTSKFRGDKNLAIGAWGARSGGGAEQGNGYGVAVELPNDRWWSATRVHHFDAGLRPGIGFLPRPGTTHFQSINSFQPRPDPQGRFGFLRQVFYGYEAQAVVNARGQTETAAAAIWPFSWEFQSGDSVEVIVRPQREFLPAPFEIAPGVVLPVGSYTFARTRGSVSSSRFRRWRTQAEAESGGFYNGRLLQTLAALDWNAPDGRWQFELAQEQNFGRLPQGSFVQRLWRTRAVFAPSPYLSVISLFQYDSVSANLGTNTRLQWTIRPGRECIVVWNRGWRTLPLRREDLSLIPDSESFTIKLRWTWRI